MCSPGMLYRGESQKYICMRLSKIISSAIEKGKLIVKILGYGSKDVQTIHNVQPFGIDARPVPGYRGIYADTASKEEKILIGIIHESVLVDEGEIRLRSEDSDKAEQAYLYLKNDGNIEINGDADNLMRFLNTKAVIEEIQNDLASIKQVFSTTWTPVPNDGGAALKTAAATWAGAALTENIDDSKIDNVKTN